MNSMEKITLFYFLTLSLVSIGIEARSLPKAPKAPRGFTIPKAAAPHHIYQAPVEVAAYPHYRSSVTNKKDEILREASLLFKQKGLSAQDARSLYANIQETIKQTLDDNDKASALAELQETFDTFRFDIQERIEKLKANPDANSRILKFIFEMENSSGMDRRNKARQEIKKIIKNEEALWLNAIYEFYQMREQQIYIK